MSPRPYIRPAFTTSWWLAQPRYIRYMAREVSCFLIGAYTGVVVVGLLRLSQGEAAWSGFLEALQTPLSIAFHLLALAFALYHTTTWFNVTPKAMPLQFGETQVPGAIIIGVHYAGWVVVSALILFLVGV
ncbi:MAG: fumarate reductase subunit C [Rhodospirillales bacterium]|nr:fumarate reductase subunit C [Rhodospirillales bacterium]